MALVLFGALLIVLFAGFAIAQGIGSPSIPSGDVALVEEVPSEIGHVSQAELDHGIEQQAAQAKLKIVPRAGTKKYEELMTAALGEILDAVWIQGEAEEKGISVTPKKLATELAQIKKQNFKTEAAYAKFLKTAHFTQADVDRRVKLQVLSTAIQEQVSKGGPKPSESEVSSYYDASKDTQYTTPATRDIRVIVNKDEKKANEAKAKLEKDSSPKNWNQIAVRFSEDQSTNHKGGLQQGLSEELLTGQDALKEAIFGHGTGELTGPVAFTPPGGKASDKKFYVVEVVKLNPEKVQPLDAVKTQIKQQLEGQLSQEYFSEFVARYQSKWQSRTFCADGFVTERCSNYKGTGHPATADPGCYEADPKGGLPEACQAPVLQPSPALPGTTTILKPQGERLQQRPRPAGLKESSATEGLQLPAGATPEVAPEAGG